MSARHFSSVNECLARAAIAINDAMCVIADNITKGVIILMELILKKLNRVKLC